MQIYFTSFLSVWPRVWHVGDAYGIVPGPEFHMWNGPEFRYTCTYEQRGLTGIPVTLLFKKTSASLRPFNGVSTLPLSWSVDVSYD
jgi:hypothetical protein